MNEYIILIQDLDFINNFYFFVILKFVNKCNSHEKSHTAVKCNIFTIESSLMCNYQTNKDDNFNKRQYN